MAKSSMAANRKSKKLTDMSVDEFLADDLDSESESSSRSADPDLSKKKKKLKKKSASKTKIAPKNDGETNKMEENEKQKTGKKLKKKEIKEKTKPVPNSNGLKAKKTNGESKQSLAKSLKETDPEFYEFLKGEDKSLLSNLETMSDESDEDADIDDDVNHQAPEEDKDFEKELINMSSGDESDSDEDTGLHKLPQELEEASDDSDVEEEDDDEKPKKKKGGILLTNKMINAWGEELKKTNPSHFVFRQVFSAFHAAVEEAGGGGEKTVSKYRVEGSAVFNNIVRLCLERVAPTLQKMLHLPTLSLSQTTEAKPFEKTGTWKKIKVNVKSYLSDVLDLLGQLSEAVMVNAILKHVHKLVTFYANFPKLAKMLLKRMIKMWTNGEETTRVLAFLCINKLVHLRQDALLEQCLKQMYTAYVSHCKFTSPSTLPLINFMQRSLVEIFIIDQTVAYQYAFIYIRQMAIHLRNAISMKKKSNCQAVYNWQYIHCIGLWVKLLTTTYPSDILQPMVYPLTQTIIGVIKLLPTARFYPLRFHCVKLLNNLSAKTNTFIPTLPFLLEILEQTDFNKRHKTVSLKPFNFAVILKFSKSQLNEKAFRDGLVDQLYELLMESYHNKSCSIGFPELIIPSVIQLKDFLKKCKIANYCKQFKQIVDKVMEQSTFISEKRKYCGLQLDDFSGISRWEEDLKNAGSPLDKYFTSWRKLRDREIMSELSNKEAISGAAIEIPMIERKMMKKASQSKEQSKDREDLSKLFENDSESDDESRFLLKEERPDNKRKRDPNDSGSDDYSDWDDDELEKLAQSASSGEESDDASIEMESDEEVKKPSKKIETKKPNKKQRSDPEPDNAIEKDDVVADFDMAEFDSD